MLVSGGYTLIPEEPEYLSSQFSIPNNLIESEDWKERCRAFSDKHVSSSVVATDKASAPRRLAYIQNKSDWHFRKHLTPFWRTLSDRPLEIGQNAVTDDCVAFVGEFATGHAPPSKELIGAGIAQLLVSDLKVSSLQLD
ncbi:hypothetical protein ACTXPX_17925 [Glutamicibacter arilaitensis]|uniref:hypothetical protein n=1 Tax=Glutamicibacter arilaitensis TaxID=256701 RepID=UPI003FD27441